MRINIVAVGKLKEKFFTQAFDEYFKRLGKFTKLKLIEVEEFSNEKNISKKQEQEGKLLLSKCEGIIICLDRLGTMVSSEELANILSDAQNSSKGAVTFLVGGSNGVSKEVLEKSDLVISFGKITFPHQLFRVVLLEQIYRAYTIISGLPYHK